MSGYLHLTARLATTEDQPLLQQLFAVERAAELAHLPLPPAQMEQLIAMQLHARDASYAASYPNATDYILCLADGTPVGRHLIDRPSVNGQPECLRTVDLAILPEFRNRRFGAWALRRLQLEALRENLPCRLRVACTSPARRLYNRQGYTVIAQDEFSCEMEWRFSRREGDLSHDELLARIVPFLRHIGLAVDFAPTGAEVFLPGIRLQQNGLVLDLENLLYPADILHEAGHLAVMPPEARNSAHPEPTDGGEELAATAWSYAAALHLGIPVTQVIHDNGFRGSAEVIRSALAQQSFGVPLLHWMGLTTHPCDGNPGLYPKMTHWVRQNPIAFASEAASTQLIEEVCA